MFRVGISGDLLNSRDEPCFGIEPLNLLKDREDIEISWMDKSIIELDTEMTSKFDEIYQKQMLIVCLIPIVN